MPSDHEDRMNRVRICFAGLSVGDAFGDTFFTDEAIIEERVAERRVAAPPWFYSDDSAMARNVARSLDLFGRIDRDWLAESFANTYQCDPRRGYGGTAQQILRSISGGEHWSVAAKKVFGGIGSCGNGGAMRSAPVGAYFSDNIPALVENARASAEVTHAHPEGQSGAIAIALAAAWMVRARPVVNQPSPDLIRFVLEHLPDGETAGRTRKALSFPFECSPSTPARTLGAGYQLTAQDTVPFCLWCAARHPASFTDALWATVRGGGDCDTTCAIVGGIVVLGAGLEGIPADWMSAREDIAI